MRAARLGSLAYYYMGTGNAENEDAISSIILGNSLLTGARRAVAGEYEIKNVAGDEDHGQLRRRADRSPNTTRWISTTTWCSWATTAPATSRSPQGKTKVRPLEVYHGKVGRGLSVEMSVKHGPVTLLSVVRDRRTAGSSCSWPKANRCPVRSWRSATPTAATVSPSARADSSTTGTPTARRITAPSASATSPTKSRSSARSWLSRRCAYAERGDRCSLGPWHREAVSRILAGGEGRGFCGPPIRRASPPAMILSAASRRPAGAFAASSGRVQILARNMLIGQSRKMGVLTDSEQGNT